MCRILWSYGAQTLQHEVCVDRTCACRGPRLCICTPKKRDLEPRSTHPSLSHTHIHCNHPLILGAVLACCRRNIMMVVRHLPPCRPRHLPQPRSRPLPALCRLTRGGSGKRPRHDTSACCHIKCMAWKQRALLASCYRGDANALIGLFMRQSPQLCVALCACLPLPPSAGMSPATTWASSSTPRSRCGVSNGTGCG